MVFRQNSSHLNASHVPKKADRINTKQRENTEWDRGADTWPPSGKSGLRIRKQRKADSDFELKSSLVPELVCNYGNARVLITCDVTSVKLQFELSGGKRVKEAFF